ncbi:MAG: ImmA/IrrE family metallo-endopeptidase [Firmicutes bacterium]|nr:ImmA/IrrE family metallo-endopeptidase [Alicyclobacillaceae bacterium]MCL6498117.1 ImmA/IrrE family metallo-endopeptidase [Bacillota bacterium]
MPMGRQDAWEAEEDRSDDPARIVRLAQMVWRRNGWEGPPFGPRLVAAMEGWPVATQVITFDRARAILGPDCPPKPEKYDAEVVAERREDGTVRYLVIYVPERPLARIWWSLAHEFGHIVLGHAVEPAARDTPWRNRQADIFAAELLMPLGAVLEVRQAPAWWVARRFGVSLQAAANRLEDLKRGWLRFYTLEELEAGRNLLRRPPRQAVREGVPAHRGACPAAPLPEEEVRGDRMTSGNGRSPGASDGNGVTWFVANGGSDRFPKLAACPVCGFVNDSPHAPLERFCGGCGQLLINACEWSECAYHHVPLPPGYRYCGVCGQPTSWHDLDDAVRRAAREQWEAEIEPVPLPDDLPF